MAIVGWVLLSLLALVLLVLFLPLRIKLEYTETFLLRVYLFGCIRVYKLGGVESLKAKPEKPKKDKPVTEQAVSEKPQKPSLREELNALKGREGLGGVIELFKRLLRIVTTALRRLVSFITVRRLSLFVRVGGEEADAVAKSYGAVNAVLFPLLEALSRVLRIRKKQVLVRPDFLGDGTSARLRMILWVWPFGIVWAAACALIRFIVTWFKAINVPSGTSQTVNTDRI